MITVSLPYLFYCRASTLKDREPQICQTSRGDINLCIIILRPQSFQKELLRYVVYQSHHISLSVNMNQA